MTFTLTDELIDTIISAMENQEKIYIVEAETNQIVEAGSNVKTDENRFYDLPEWKPADGYRLLEDFVNHLHAPIARDELQAVLHSGRGVFKNFKNVLKNYPEIDKRWHIYKHRIMSARINEWYNSLREIWGLEKLDYEQEENDSLVCNDFSFREYNSEIDRKSVLFSISAVFFDDEQSEDLEISAPVNKVIFEFWKKQFESADQKEQTGFICTSLSEDFSGVITTSSLNNNQDGLEVVTSFFVPEQFRGLGIGTELFSMCISNLKKSGKKWILMPNIIVPEILRPLLLRTGFEQKRFGYIAEIQKI